MRVSCDEGGEHVTELRLASVVEIITSEGCLYRQQLIALHV